MNFNDELGDAAE